MYQNAYNVMLAFVLGLLAIASLLAILRKIGDPKQVEFPADMGSGDANFDLAMFQTILGLVGTLIAAIIFPVLIWNLWGQVAAYLLVAALGLLVLETAFGLRAIYQSSQVGDKEVCS